MVCKKISLSALAGAALMMAGCSSERFGGNSTPVVPPVAIQAAPLGEVSQSTLPPPGNYPDAPGGQGQAPMTDVAAIAPAGVALTPAGIAGVWKASIGGMTCQVATPQTNLARGYRAGPLRCPEAFSRVNSWAVRGSQLVFYDKAGGNVATLYSSDGARFEGRTVSGLQVTLTR